MTVFIQRVQVHGMYTLSCGPEVAVVLFAVLICCLLKEKLSVWRPNDIQTKRNYDQTKFGPNEIRTKRYSDQTIFGPNDIGPNDVRTKRYSDQTNFGPNDILNQTMLSP